MEEEASSSAVEGESQTCYTSGFDLISTFLHIFLSMIILYDEEAGEI